MNDSNDNYDNGREDGMHRWGPDARKPRFTHGGVYAGHGPHGYVIGGVIALLLGILFLLENLGFFYVAQIWQFWPVILIAVGVVHILDARDLGGTIWGAVIAGAGAVFLANTLGYLPWYLWGLLWPVLLICAGITILLSGFGRQRGWAALHSLVHDSSANSDNVLKAVVVFGGINRRVEAQDFQGGEATAIFGGVEVNLRRASTTRDEIEIVASAVFGGVELTVPDTWDVIVRGAGMLGGYVDKTHPAPLNGGKHPRLVIRGSAVFGGVTVRN